MFAKNSDAAEKKSNSIWYAFIETKLEMQKKHQNEKNVLVSYFMICLINYCF